MSNLMEFARYSCILSNVMIGLTENGIIAGYWTRFLIGE
jgi:hypothetical protein